MSPPIVTETLGEKSAPALRLKLRVVDGPDLGAELPLEAGTYRIGKEAGNDLVLTDSAVSRTHLRVEVLQSRARFVDNQSTNGSFSEGLRFTSIEGSVGTTVTIGRTTLKLVPLHERAPGIAPAQSERFGKLVGRSLPMRELFGKLERLAKVDSDVLVFGETGTGKELCAEALHEEGPRAKGPFVICDLAGIAPSLIESELFGHVKGAFTGAVGDRAGAFEQAHGGTLFLDEVGELSAEVQPRLLRALERRQIKRVGANQYLTVNVRVIAATHRNLSADVTAGRFRADLFHRLAVAEVRMPPLRERAEDIPLLVDGLLARIGRPASALSPETRALLAGYDWPGNVRELRNVVERAVHLGETPELHGSAPLAAPAGLGNTHLPFKQAKEQLIQAFERDYLAQLLKTCEGNLSRASREAGIDRVYLRKLVRKHGLGAGGDDEG